MRSMILMCAGAAIVGLVGGPAPANAQTAGYVGEVIFLGENFCPIGTLPANGSLLPISQFQPLFSLFGTRYGGNGTTTFALPKVTMQTRTPGAPLTACVIAQGAYPTR